MQVLFVEIPILISSRNLLEKKLLLKVDTKPVGVDKYFGTFRVRRICDDATIIAMFELPNYDADDESGTWKDAIKSETVLGESSNAVTERSPLPLHPLSTEGETSGVKKESPVLIDFLGKKEANIPEVEQFAADPHSVEEQVDGNAENDGLSDEIIAHLHSPLDESQEVISNMFEDSPKAVENAVSTNVRRGEKVKRNLNDEFNKIGEAEIGRATKISKTSGD
ncbi:hypothetical protein PIB30_042003 [Stylosanthes scabra]|uniref:Uncharacterized protein n=1 Tax=Stylosanthes scabra TaxID=79078 RepID=A0ABU6QEK7_9FABA|nr:hypothetical protein [Stylosanthes scabra]